MQQSTISSTLALIQYHKERNKKEAMAQYFDYGFVEETFKTYINQQVQQFYDQSRITQALNAQQDGKDDDEEDETDGAGNDSIDNKGVGLGPDKKDIEGMKAGSKDKKSSQKQKIIMYKEYLEQRAHRQIYKQIREDLKQQ